LKKHEANDPIIWDNVYPYGMIPIFIGKKRKHVMDLIAGLELNGPSTTTEVAKFVLSSFFTPGQLNEFHKNVIKHRAHAYWKHIHEGAYKTEHKKKVGKYPSLLEEDFIQITSETKSKKNIDMGIYFPTLKGHLVSLGYKFNGSQLQNFITNSSRNSLYFAFLKSIMEQIGLLFVKKLFLIPIQEMIKDRRIRFDDNYRLNYDLIASATALKIYNIIGASWTEIYSYNPITDSYPVSSDKKLIKQLDQLMKLTWFDLSTKEKWIQNMVDLYYPSIAEKDFYLLRSDFSDAVLLYKVMREIHNSYYDAYRVRVPSKYHQKFPIPIRRNRKQRKPIHPKNKTRFTGLELFEYEKQHKKK